MAMASYATWWGRGVVCLLGALPLLAGAAADGRQQGKVDLLRIGSSGSLNGDKTDDKEKSALATLKSFIKDETGLNNEIVEQKDWQELTDKLAKGQVHVGVYQGYEFAWAQEKHPELRPLALAINVHRYPTAHVVTNVKNKSKDFAGLQGQSFAIPVSAPRFLRFFVERQTEKAGKTPEAFFAKVTRPKEVDVALDDVVDGVVNAMVVDRAALEAFKQEKPARFKKLKEVMHSGPTPPPIVAYYGKYLDNDTRERFRTGLLGANKKETGKQMLEFFGLTHFEPVPNDFAKLLADTRKTYPPSEAKTK